MSASRKPTESEAMTVAEFLAWNPGDGRLWQLVDGEPVAMAPASQTHGAIQSESNRLLGNHLAERGSRCRIVTTPGVVPRVGANENVRVPDLGVTCTPPSLDHMMPNPVLLVEVLSPSNVAETRANIWSYTTIPSVREILLVHSARRRGTAPPRRGRGMAGGTDDARAGRHPGAGRRRRLLDAARRPVSHDTARGGLTRWVGSPRRGRSPGMGVGRPGAAQLLPIRMPAASTSAPPSITFATAESGGVSMYFH